MRESLNIMAQALQYLQYLSSKKDFTYIINDFKIVPPTRGLLKYSMDP